MQSSKGYVGGEAKQERRLRADVGVRPVFAAASHGPGDAHVVKFSSGYHPHGILCSCRRATYREGVSEDGTTPASDHDPIALCSDLEGRSGRRHRAAYTHTDDSHHATNRRLSPNAATCTPCVLIYIRTNTLEPGQKYVAKNLLKFIAKRAVHRWVRVYSISYG